MSKSITEKGGVSFPNIKGPIPYVKRSLIPASLLSPALQVDSLLLKYHLPLLLDIKLRTDIVQDTGIKTIPMEKKCKKAKWLSGEDLQIAVKRREAKSKGEKERYKHLNAEFQRLARRDKKAFLSDQCKEIEENNRMGKTRDLFKKIRHTKGTFHAKMGLIKDRNGMDLTEAEDIKKRWQEYTKELYKKDLHDADNHDGVITHLEPESWNVKSSGP